MRWHAEMYDLILEPHAFNRKGRDFDLRIEFSSCEIHEIITIGIRPDHFIVICKKNVIDGDLSEAAYRNRNFFK